MGFSLDLKVGTTIEVSCNGKKAVGVVRKRRGKRPVLWLHDPHRLIRKAKTGSAQSDVSEN